MKLTDLLNSAFFLPEYEKTKTLVGWRVNTDYILEEYGSGAVLEYDGDEVSEVLMNEGGYIVFFFHRNYVQGLSADNDKEYNFQVVRLERVVLDRV